MKISLISCKGPEGTMTSLPQGLLQLTAELNAGGHSVDIIDYNYLPVPSSYDHLEKYDLVGLSVMSTQLPHAVQIADAINNKVKIVWGGIHCLLDPSSILNSYPSHYVITGEGETPLLQFIEYLEGHQSKEWLEQQPGICFRSNDKIITNRPYYIKDINKLHDINYYDLPNLEIYLQQHEYFFRQPVNLLHILVARGCPFNCNFCINSLHRKYGGSYRIKSIEKIRRESEQVIKDFNIKFIQPRDECFFTNKKLLDDWLEFVRGKDLLWSANCRFDYFRDNYINTSFLQELVDSGLYSLGMSVEAGSEDTRINVLNKRIRNNQIYHAIDTIKKSVGKKLVLATSFIAYFPGDSQKNRIEILKWMDYLSKHANTVFSGPQIYRSYPGSKLYENENLKYTGNIDYYLNDIDFTGTSKKIKNKLNSYFFSDFIIEYFNRQTKFLNIKPSVNGKPNWDLNIDNDQKSKRDIMYYLMVSVRLRLRLNFWFLFIEPTLIPWIYFRYPNFMIFINRLKSYAVVLRNPRHLITNIQKRIFNVNKK